MKPRKAKPSKARATCIIFFVSDCSSISKSRKMVQQNITIYKADIKVGENQVKLKVFKVQLLVIYLVSSSENKTILY